MLTWITNIVVLSWFWKVCWLVSPMSITELLHPKVCWLESRHSCVFFILTSMLTCFIHGYHWIASSKIMLTWITDIIVFSWFWKVCWLVSPMGVTAWYTWIYRYCQLLLGSYKVCWLTLIYRHIYWNGVP